MDEITRNEIIRLFNAPHHRPFAEIDKRLNLPKGAACQFLIKEGLFERAVFRYRSAPQKRYKKAVDTTKQLG